jgi:hypothetical protein
MANVVIVGAQWGDEGKGKVVDLYTEFADTVVRFGGWRQCWSYARRRWAEAGNPLGAVGACCADEASAAYLATGW